MADLAEPLHRVKARAAKIRLAAFDVDGVLTDGSLILGDRGEQFKVFHTHDGQGLTMLREAGLHIAVISGRSSAAVEERMADLGIRYVYQGASDKLSIFNALLRELGLSAEQAAFMGDDVPDLPVMIRAGLAVAVADAHHLVCKHAHWRTRQPGGRGAVRELCELLLDAQGALANLYDRYLR